MTCALTADICKQRRTLPVWDCLPGCLHCSCACALTQLCTEWGPRSVLRERFAKAEELSLFAITTAMARRDAARLFYQLCGAQPRAGPSHHVLQTRVM